MWRKRGTAIWVIIGVAIVSGFFVSSCGGTASSQETKHYSNATYNFAFDYGPPLAQISFPAEGAGLEFRYGVGQKPSRADFDNLVGNWLLIGVTKGEPSADPRVVGTAWLRGQAKTARQLDSFTLLASKQTTLGQLSAYLFEGQGSEAGKTLHIKTMLVVTPQYCYDLMAQADVNVWDGTVGREIQKSQSSFRLVQTPSGVVNGATPRPASSTLYRNSQFRFTLRYPASFGKVGKDEIPNAQATVDFAVGFLDTEAAAQAAQSGTLDGVLIQVIRAPRKVTAAQAQYALRLARAAQEKQTTAQYENAYPGAHVSGIRMGHFNGLPCYVFDVSYPYAASWQHEKDYCILVGAFLYQIQLASPQADWNANKKALERIAHTFRTF